MTDVELNVQEVDWAMLRPHAKRGGLYLLDAAEDLMEVAVAMRDDDVPTIRALIERGALAAPDTDLIEGPDEPHYRFVIVQPYVIAQGPLQ